MSAWSADMHMVGCGAGESWASGRNVLVVEAMGCPCGGGQRAHAVYLPSGADTAEHSLCTQALAQPNMAMLSRTSP